MADRADVGISDGTQTPSLFADCHNPPTVQSALSSAVSRVTLMSHGKQALVYDILPSTTGVFSYAIGFRKLSANEQFFVGAQRVISLLQRTQIK